MTSRVSGDADQALSVIDSLRAEDSAVGGLADLCLYFVEHPRATRLPTDLMQEFVLSLAAQSRGAALHWDIQHKDVSSAGERSAILPVH